MKPKPTDKVKPLDQPAFEAFAKRNNLTERERVWAIVGWNARAYVELRKALKV